MRRWFDKLRSRFDELGITYADAAEALGVATSTVGAWMIGRNEPPISRIQHLAKLAGVTLAWLVEDDPLYAATEEERALLVMFRRIGAGERDAALTLLSVVAQASPSYAAGDQPATDQPDKD